MRSFLDYKAFLVIVLGVILIVSVSIPWDVIKAFAIAYYLIGWIQVLGHVLEDGDFDFTLSEFVVIAVGFPVIYPFVYRGLHKDGYLFQTVTNEGETA